MRPEAVTSDKRREVGLKCYNSNLHLSIKRAPFLLRILARQCCSLLMRRLLNIHYSILLFLLLFTIQMPPSDALTRIATFSLSPFTKLCIVRGSVVDFSFPKRAAAIVNAANPACLGGGGVDGAITSAGGPMLHKHRMALPVVEVAGSKNIRCPTGHAKMTGPGTYGDLQVPYVIHAVGPCYYDYNELQEGDTLLTSAYYESLQRAQEVPLEAICFSLLSAGVYRGDQTLKNVLTIGITTIWDWIQQHEDTTTLSHVFLCGFTPLETNMLVDICQDDLKLAFVQEEQDTATFPNGDATKEEEKEDDDNDMEDKNNDAVANDEKKEETAAAAESNQEEGLCNENGGEITPNKELAEDAKMEGEQGEKPSNKRSSDHL